MTTQAFIEGITLDELENDPYPIYARLRREAPVAWIPAAEVWFVTGFDDCAAVGSGEHGFTGGKNHPTLQRVFGDPNVLTAEGEEHEDLRKGIDPSLQPRSVNAVIDDLARPIARKYLAQIAARGHGELMAEYFEPVSVDALRAVMGLDDLVDSDTLRRWFRDLNAGVANFGQDPEVFAISDSISAEIEAVVRPRFAQLLEHPDDSMLSHMLWAGREGGEPRPVEMLLPSLKVMLLGGMQEPGHAAGSTLLGLFGEPEQWQKLLEDPDEYIPLAVHEGMRWIAPIGAVERVATRDVEIGGATIPAGAFVQIVLGSANRDETHFDDPDRFDMERSNRVNQVFGNGVHFCAGHFFARQLQRIMFEELLPALPGLRPDPEHEPLVTGWVFRAPKSLPVLWDPVSEAEAAALVAPSEADRASDAAPGSAGPVRVAGDPDARMLRVVAMRHEADGVVSIELADPSGEPLAPWRPGAHVDLWPSPQRAGQYSLAGDPDDRHRYRIAVRREEHSRGVSDFVHDELRVGETVPIGGPRNHFALAPARRYVFIAGGIGVTPMLPMLRAAHKAGAQAALVYCGRSRRTMAFLAELDELYGGGRDGGAPGDVIRIHASDEGRRADLDTIVRDAAEAGAEIYACGPE
ncbi:MAG: cytochrome P450, partial [Leucobacter sp.]|nr:cytochrome P450 [Leucobacter sp.]